MVEAFLGLGSNLGDRQANLERALDALSGFGPVRRSMLYETDAVGLSGAPPFLNGAAGLVTELEPAGLLAEIGRIEVELGRDVVHRQGSRPIDIDLLLYGDSVIATAELTVPHPRMHERAFVLVPLAELAPEAVHPVTGRSVSELLALVSTDGVRPWFS